MSVRRCALQCSRRALAVDVRVLALRRPLSSTSDGGSSSSLGDRAKSMFGVTATQEKATEKLMSEVSRGKGWRESLETGLVEQQRLKRKDAVSEQLNKMAAMESYGFDDLVDLLHMQLNELENGITRLQKTRMWADKYIQGGKMSDNIEQQKETARLKLRIIGELTVHEKRRPKLLDKKARRAIAEKLAINVETIDELLFEYQLQRAQWSWLRREALRGRTIPQTSEDMEWMMKMRPTREFVHVMTAYETRRQELKEQLENRAKAGA